MDDIKLESPELEDSKKQLKEDFDKFVSEMVKKHSIISMTVMAELPENTEPVHAMHGHPYNVLLLVKWLYSGLFGQLIPRTFMENQSR